MWSPIQAVPLGSGNLEMRLQPRLSVTEGAIVQHAIQHVTGELRPEKLFPHTFLLLPPLLDYLTRKESATKVMCLSLTVSHFATTTGHRQSISTRSANCCSRKSPHLYDVTSPRRQFVSASRAPHIRSPYTVYLPQRQHSTRLARPIRIYSSLT